MTDEEYKERFQKFEIERREREEEVNNILLDKLKEMAEVQHNYCIDGSDYAMICSAMSDMAKIILGIA